jgi:hypothetical protein
MVSGRKKPIIGLDIGSYAIKGIVLDETKSGTVLRAMAWPTCRPTPSLRARSRKRKDLGHGDPEISSKSLKTKVRHVFDLHIGLFGDHQKRSACPGATREETGRKTLKSRPAVSSRSILPKSMSISRFWAQTR